VYYYCDIGFIVYSMKQSQVLKHILILLYSINVVQV